MIEFELKFKINEVPTAIEKYNVTKHKNGEDLYYDTKDYRLIRNGNFLRVRNGKTIDFKLDIGDDEHIYCKETNFGLESVDSQNQDFLNIFRVLNIQIDDKKFDNFEEFIKINNLVLLAPVKKHRDIYIINDSLTILVDNVENIGLYMEAELNFEDGKELNKHELRELLLAELNELDIISDPYNLVKIGYVEIYLMEHNKEAYELGKFKA